MSTLIKTSRVPVRGNIAVGEIPHHHDEVRTINRNLFATFDYGFTQNLGASLVVPWVDRKHEHIHNHRGAALPESWNFSEFGMFD